MEENKTVEKPDEVKASEEVTKSPEELEADKLAQLIKDDPVEAAKQLKKLREENKTMRLRSKEAESMLSTLKAKEEAKKMADLEAKGEYQTLITTLKSQVEELIPFKDKWLKEEEKQVRLFNDKLGKIENESHRKLLEASTLPLSDRLSLVESLLPQANPSQNPNPVERGGGIKAKGSEPVATSKLFDPNR